MCNKLKLMIVSFLDFYSQTIHPESKLSKTDTVHTACGPLIRLEQMVCAMCHAWNSLLGRLCNTLTRFDENFLQFSSL